MSAQFDSLGYANRLKNAGMDEKQAEVQAETLLHVVNDQLLTKYDLREVKAELNQNIKDVEVKLSQEIKDVEVKLSQDIKDVKIELRQEIQEIKRDMKELEMRLIIKLTGILAIVMGILLKLLH